MGLNPNNYYYFNNMGTMSALSPCGYSQSSADSRDDMSVSPPLSVTLSPKSMNNLLNMSHDEQVANNIIAMRDPEAPYMRITEQPVEKFRFRYKSEMMGTHGSLLGKTNSSEKSRKKSYPTVELCNYDGAAVIRCSLYTAQREAALRTPHAHHLVIKVANSSEVDDPHQIEVNGKLGYQAVFQGMGVIHTAKKYIVDVLLAKKKAALLEDRRFSKNSNKAELTQAELARLRKEVSSEARTMDLNVVTLCFDCFELLPNNQIGLPLCQRIFSTSINNMKSALTGELKICRIDRHVSSCRGNEEVFMLVEKVGKKNIRVKMFETDEEDNEIWVDYGKFSELDVHHQFAIVFRTPPYRDLHIQKPVKVFLQLYRPTDGDRSEPIGFTYKPDAAAALITAGRKRKRTATAGENENGPVLTIEEDDSQDNVLTPLLPPFFPTPMPNGLNMTGPDTNATYLNGSYNPVMPQHPDAPFDFADHFMSFPSIEQVLNADGRLPSAEVYDFLENFPSNEYNWSNMDLACDGASTRQLRPITSTAAPAQPPTTARKPKTAVPEPEVSSAEAPAAETASEPDDGTESHVSEADGSIPAPPIGEPTVGQAKAPAPLIKVRTDLSARTGKVSLDLQPCEELQLPTANAPLPAADPQLPAANVELPAADVELPAADPEPPAAGSPQKFPSPQKAPQDPEAVVRRVTAKITQMLVRQQDDPPQKMANAVRDMFNAERTEDGETALHVAVAHQETDYLTVMINAMCTGQPCFGPQGSLKDVLDLCNDKDETALHLSVLLNRAGAVAALLRGGANPNLSDAAGDYPLHLAVCHAHRAPLKELLDKRNYRVGTRALHLNAKNEQGWTALHLAALRHDAHAARLLCEAGADPNARDKSGGRSALHLAVEEQCVPVARYLLRRTPVDIDMQNAAGNTALHVAVVVGESGSRELCDLLLRAKANPHLANYGPANYGKGRNPEEGEESEEEDEGDETESRTTALDLATDNKEIFDLIQNSMESQTNGNADDDKVLVVEVKKESEDEDNFQAVGGDPMFDSATLDKLCSILDQNSSWERLAKLLDYGFLVSSLRSTDVTSASKALLNYTELRGNVTLDKVRDLLAVLDERKAVEIIDLMLARRFVERDD